MKRENPANWHEETSQIGRVDILSTSANIILRDRMKLLYVLTCFERMAIKFMKMDENASCVYPVVHSSSIEQFVHGLIYMCYSISI